MKKNLLFTALLCLALLPLPGCSCRDKDPEPGRIPEAGAALELAERFCPVLYLKNDVEPVENYKPAAIEAFIGDSVLVAASDTTLWEKAVLPWLRDFFSSDFYLDVPELSPADIPDVLPYYKASYDTATASLPVTIYARVLESAGTGHTILQYWLFYYFNDWRNVHEGDWELVQLVFPGESARDILDSGIEPLFTALSQHQAGQRMSWEAMKQQGLVENGRPAVYVAQGSHANFFTPGQYWSILDFDDTGLSSWKRIVPEAVVLLDESGEDAAFDWLEFEGNWGELLGFSVSVSELSFSHSGPTGPAWSSQGTRDIKWEQPYAWASGLPEYPSPFWTSFIPGLAKFWPKLAIFSVFSPADIHVYDGQGRHVGLDETGAFVTEIPGAVYLTPENTDFKTIVIPDADISDDYLLVISGTGTGVMDIATQVPDAVAGTRQYVRFMDIPVTPQTTAVLEIKPVVPSVPPIPGGSVRDTATSLVVDRDGDKVFESEVKPGRSSITPAAVIPAFSVDIPSLRPVPGKTTLTIKTQGEGTTRPAPGIHTYPRNEVITVTAIPDSGWAFERWQGDIHETTDTIRIVMDKDKSIIAVFTPVPPSLELDQINEPELQSTIHSITNESRLSQSFIPAVTRLAAVEIKVQFVNDTSLADSVINLEIIDSSQKVLASANASLADNREEWLTFDFGDGVAVVPGEIYYLALTASADTPIGWRYSDAFYPRGSAFINGQAMRGGFFFRTWGWHENPIRE